MKLKPCPFCGSSDIGLGWRLPLFGEETTKFVVCNCCGCMTAPFRNENEAVEIWNKRADNG